MNLQEARDIQTANRADGRPVALQRLVENRIEDGLPDHRALKGTDRQKVTLEEVAPIRGNTLDDPDRDLAIQRDHPDGLGHGLVPRTRRGKGRVTRDDRDRAVDRTGGVRGVKDRAAGRTAKGRDGQGQDRPAGVRGLTEDEAWWGKKFDRSAGCTLL